MLAYFSSIDWQPALIGGLLIGLSVSLLLLFNGRIAGICGIAFSLMQRAGAVQLWRWFFVAGLLLGTWLVHQLLAVQLPQPPNSNIALLIVAGLLVGFGSTLANGCTSGHGVCGLARFSPRSLLATLSFMGAGFVTMAVLRLGFGG